MDTENIKFKANPYNSTNKLISKEDVLNIMKSQSSRQIIGLKT